MVYSVEELDLLLLQLFSQRASFSLRVSVMKAKNLMAKDANGETSQALFLLLENKQSVKYDLDSNYMKCKKKQKNCK